MGWRPWRVLRGRPHLVLRWAPLRPGRGLIEDHGGGRRRITLDPGLDQRTRSETLGHELVHDELDLLWLPGTPPALIEKGERLVERINAERTVPLGVLQAYVDRMVDLGEGVTAEMVADEFGTTVELADLVLRLLANDPRRAA